MRQSYRAIGVLLLASTALTGHAFAAAQTDDTQARLRALEDELNNVNAQLADLKRSQSDQYSDVNRKLDAGVAVTIKNGRPTFATTDGEFSLAIRSLVQFDTAYYGQGKMPPGTDFSSGSNFRRARLGVEGTLFTDWSYQFIYDFGGSGTEGSTISSAYIQYNGLGQVHFKAGAYAPPESFDDSTSASDLLFLERAQPTDLARGIAGADGRDAFTAFAYDDRYFAAVSYTGGVVGDAAVFDEQQAIVDRFAYRLVKTDDANFAIGADSSYVFKLADTVAGHNSPTAFRLRERPELNVDSQNIRLIDTGTLDASDVLEWGVEATGNWRSLYAQGGYFNFDVTRRTGVLPDSSFDGWYLQASWVLTGESKTYRPEIGAYGLPKPAENFTFDKGGIGAWELAARYSDLDLNYNEGLDGVAKPASGIRGGDQRIWTVGVNWYPNPAIRLVLDYQHTDVSRLNAAGGDIGARLDAVSFRTQLSL
ncbi:MAG TPA: porin [Rhizomicrobium sp.]|nr:porin [Rhizomicrobium sp.]